MTQSAPGERPGATVHVLVGEAVIGLAPDLHDEATGAALLCYTAARDEAEAVRETVSTLRQAGLAPLGVTAEDAPPDPDLARRALEDDSVIVAQITHFRD